MPSMVKDLYSKHPFTLLCSEPILSNFTVETQPCSGCPKHVEPIKWISIVPPKRIIENRPCQKQPMCRNSKGKPTKGLLCCKKNDILVQEILNDPHLYAPEDPNLAKILHSYRPGKAQMHSKVLYSCNLSINKKEKTYEAPHQSKGLIARTYLYLETKYGMKLTKEEKELLIQWHYEAPPSIWEKERNHLITLSKGHNNPWVA